MFVLGWLFIVLIFQVNNNSEKITFIHGGVSLEVKDWIVR